MRLGLVGYGVGGRYFHAPFIEAADGVELAGVVTRSPERRARAGRGLPRRAGVRRLGDLLEAGVDAVTITTPPETRRELVLQALAAGVPRHRRQAVRTDRRSGRELVAAARSRASRSTSSTTAASTATSAPSPQYWTAVRSASSGGVDRGWTRTTPPPWRPARPADCCATSAATWSTRCSGCSARPIASTPSWTGSSCPPGPPTPGSPSPSPTPAASDHTSVHTRSTTSTTASYAPTAARAATSPTAPMSRPRPSSPVRRPVDEGDAWGYEAPNGGARGHRRRRHAGAVRTRRLPGLLHAVRRALRGNRPVPGPRRQAIHTLEVLDAARISAAENRTVDLLSAHWCKSISRR